MSVIDAETTCRKTRRRLSIPRYVARETLNVENVTCKFPFFSLAAGYTLTIYFNSIICRFAGGTWTDMPYQKY